MPRKGGSRGEGGQLQPINFAPLVVSKPWDRAWDDRSCCVYLSDDRKGQQPPSTEKKLLDAGKSCPPGVADGSFDRRQRD